VKATTKEGWRRRTWFNRQFEGVAAVQVGVHAAAESLDHSHTFVSSQHLTWFNCQYEGVAAVQIDVHAAAGLSESTTSQCTAQ
jgi:hypothetical protein